MFRNLAGLFIDDGSLAILVLAVVAAAASASLLSGLWAGCVLLVGSLWALCVNVVGGVRQARRSGRISP
jgi:CHASE2 domain-containing sensor protein